MTEVALQIVDEGGRGLLRMSRQTLRTLGLAPGETVAVEGARRTHARAMPGSVADGAAVVDAWLAKNAGATKSTKALLTPTALAPLSAVVVKLRGKGAATQDQVKEALFDMALSPGDVLPVGVAAEIEVMETSPHGPGVLTEQSVLTLETGADPTLGYEGLGGLEDEIAQVHEMIAAPLLRPELYAHLGLSAPRGVLFCGPPGSGKTLLARAIAARTKAAFFHLNAPEIVTKHYGESEAALRKTFAAAEKASPAIIFIDEIDAIAPARSGLSAEKQVERRIVAQLLTLMDGLSDRGRVVVMAATNLPDVLDPALRRPGRFDREITFCQPDQADRANILKVHLANTPLAQDVDISALAEATHGYVGADLAALAREAAVAALSRTVAEAGGEAAVEIQNLHVAQCDLLKGLSNTSPSALRSDELSSETVSWEAVGGAEAVKDRLYHAVVEPVQNKPLFEEFSSSPPRGVLLSGPPGTGKTLLARALAREAGFNFIPVRPPKLLSQFFGEAERAVAELFARARQTSPTLLFFDELDSIAPRRGRDTGVVDRIVTQLLMELDGMQSNRDLIVLAATNRPSAIDPALIRPGRFDVVVEVPLPDATARSAILAIHLKDRPVDPALDVDALAKACEGFSGADLANLVQSSARNAIKRVLAKQGQRQLTLDDFDLALATLAAENKVRSTTHISEKGRDL